MSATAGQANSTVVGAHETHVHIVPFRVLATVFACLLVLTVVTVAVTKVNLGNFNLWIAMAIATVKASLVLLYFMHMRYDRPFNAVVFITALLIVALFIGIALIDTGAYQPELIPGYAPGMQRQ
jgi:cytochrome c oxidase subunit IV